MELMGIVGGASAVLVLGGWVWFMRCRVPVEMEQARRQRGLEPITWLLIIGGMVAAVIALLVLYQQVLVDQGTKIEAEEIPCVYLDPSDDTMKAGTLKGTGVCSAP